MSSISPALRPKSDATSDIGEALRLLRVFHDVKQNELATQLELSPSYLSEMERAKRPVSLEVLNRYADHFSIPMSSLLFFSETLGAKDRSKRVEAARKVISSKVLQILRFVEAKSSNAT